jgi:hypothetical protein
MALGLFLMTSSSYTGEKKDILEVGGSAVSEQLDERIKMVERLM